MEKKDYVEKAMVSYLKNDGEFILINDFKIYKINKELLPLLYNEEKKDITRLNRYVFFNA